MAENDYESLMKTGVDDALHRLAAAFLSGKNADGSDFKFFPENEEVVALPLTVMPQGVTYSDLICNSPSACCGVAD